MDVASGGMQCSDPDNRVEFIPFAAADGYISMSQSDFKKVLDYVATRCVQ